MNHFTQSGFARGGSSQEVESTKRERLPTVSMQRFTSASISLPGRALEDGHVDVADPHHAALVAERHQLVELIDLQRRIGLLVEVDGDGDEAHVDQVLVDLVRGPADVDGRADLLGLEVVHQILVVRLDELTVGVGSHQGAGGGRVGVAQADLRPEHGIAEALGVLGAKRMRSWTNSGSSIVSRHMISGLRRSMAIVHGPTSTAPSPLGTSPPRAPRTARGSRNAGRPCSARAPPAGQQALVVLQHVLIDRRARRSPSTSRGSRPPRPPWPDR